MLKGEGEVECGFRVRGVSGFRVRVLGTGCRVKVEGELGGGLRAEGGSLEFWVRMS